jgi:hypothetical protein
MENETIVAKNVWVRIAGNSRRIRAEGDLFHWRCFIANAPPEIPLRTYRVSGEADGKNVLPGTDPSSSNPLGLLAWIDFYGDVTVQNGIARVTLKTAP